jgi:hypothetical protein
MSEQIDWVVAEATPGEMATLAEKARAFLVAEGIASPSGLHVLEDGRRLMTPGPRAPEWSRHVWLSLEQCGIEIIAGARAFAGGDGRPRALTCPGCGLPQPAGTLPWRLAIESWRSAPSGGSLTCPLCRSPSNITRWRFLDAPWAFGQLGIGFHQWSIDDPLLAGLSLLLGRPCRFVRQTGAKEAR